MLDTAGGGSSPRRLHVFEKVLSPSPVAADTRWLTMLPGYPDGSFGYAQVERCLAREPGPRLYIEYLGQGDSDTPRRYRFSSIERADLIEAQWRAHGVRRTMVVTFDYSSLALLELLRRQQERIAAGELSGATVDSVLIVNGGLFADSHSHPWDTTPMLKTPAGRVAMWFGQHVPGVMEATLRNAKLFSSSYRVSDAEIADLSEAIRRRGGAAFMHRAAGSSASIAATLSGGISRRSSASLGTPSASMSRGARRTPSSTDRSTPRADDSDRWGWTSSRSRAAI